MSSDESCFIKNEGEVTFFFNRRDHREGAEDTENIKNSAFSVPPSRPLRLKKITADLFVFFHSFNRRDHREGTEDTENIKKLCVLCASFASSAVKKNHSRLIYFFILYFL
ncbi:MAG: hypothetical protein B6245_17765 [Desulfobacteraceae bacterium 4572_88]|nr:MAG: hypothetical protein B6245_17765 [Desulfobacteraceae bacterium 4572_88]